jgi:hypothetical protein
MQAARQEGARMHLLLDAAERMLNDLAATVENLWSLLQALGRWPTPIAGMASPRLTTSI